jgi:hypothetical protein
LISAHRKRERPAAAGLTLTSLPDPRVIQPCDDSQHDGKERRCDEQAAESEQQMPTLAIHSQASKRCDQRQFRRHKQNGGGWFGDNFKREIV